MIEISERVLRELHQHALEAYPEECCGVVAGRTDAPEEDRVHRCRNVQNSLHAQDSERYPRDAKTAYHMDEKEIFDIFTRAASEEKEVKFIYHSHTDLDAYFSPEDKRMAMWGDIPAYPKATYIVLSVYNGRVKGEAAFRWDEEGGDFCREELRVVG